MAGYYKRLWGREFCILLKQFAVAVFDQERQRGRTHSHLDEFAGFVAKAMVAGNVANQPFESDFRIYINSVLGGPKLVPLGYRIEALRWHLGLVSGLPRLSCKTNEDTRTIDVQAVDQRTFLMPAERGVICVANTPRALQDSKVSETCLKEWSFFRSVLAYRLVEHQCADKKPSFHEEWRLLGRIVFCRKINMWPDDLGSSR